MAVTHLWILIAYFVVVAAVALLSVSNFFGILRYGFADRASLSVTFLYLGIFVGVVVVTLVILRQVDWQQQLQLNVPLIDTTNAGPQ
ncbi:MAG: hypothetical protein V1916_01040 [Patescibacteria group bacterium]